MSTDQQAESGTRRGNRDCPYCGDEIEAGDNVKVHRRYCRLSRQFDIVMDQVEVVAKEMANINGGGLWYATSRGTGFKYRVSANPKAELKQLLAMNPQLGDIKKYPPSMWKECGEGLIDLALNGPRSAYPKP
jgi:hypothetical protein